MPYFQLFSIPFTECRLKDKTFSLLPYQLVPYTKYSIPFIIKSMKLKYIDGLSIYKLQDYLASFGKEEILSISADQLLGFKKVVMDAIHKIMTTKYYQEFEEKGLNESTDQGLLISFIEFAEGFDCTKVNPCIKGPCGLNYDFYITGGSYFKNAYFLFGTPSQFR
jgi:hypothetical protein